MNQLGGKREGQANERKNNLPSVKPFVSEQLPEVPSTTAGGLSESVKAVRTVIWVRLPTQVTNLWQVDYHSQSSYCCNKHGDQGNLGGKGLFGLRFHTSVHH